MLTIIKSTFAIALVASIGIAGYWYFSGESKRELTPVMEELAIRSAQDLANKIPRLQDIEDVLIVPVVGGRHEDQHLRGIVTQSIENKRKYTTWTWKSLENKLANGNLWQQLITQVGLVPGQPPKNSTEAKQFIDLMKRSNLRLDGVIFVKCFFDQGPRDDNLGSSVELSATIYDGNTGNEIKENLHARHGIDSHWDRLYLTHKVLSMGYIARFFGWAFFSFIPVWLVMSLSKWILNKRNNNIVAIYLGSLVAIGALSSWIFLTALADVTLITILFVIACAGVIYKVNYDALDYIYRRLL